MLRFRRPARAPRAFAPGTIALSDPAVRDRLAFLGVTADDVGRVASWRAPCDRAALALLDEVQARLRAYPPAHALVTPRPTGAHRALLASAVASLFGGRIDDTYVAARERLGRLHAEVGADAAVHGMIGEILRTAFARAIADAGAEADDRALFAAALGRMLQLDAALVARSAGAAQRRAAEASSEAPPADETDADATSRFAADAGAVLAAFAGRDLRSRVSGTYGAPLDGLATTLNRTIDDVERLVRAAARIGNDLAARSREVTAGNGSVAQGSAREAAAVALLAEHVRALGAALPAGDRGDRFAGGGRQRDAATRIAADLDRVEALLRRTTANAEEAATLSAQLTDEATRFARAACGYALREDRTAGHPRRRRTDVAPTEPVAADPSPSPEPGDVPTRFRRERRRSLFTDN